MKTTNQAMNAATALLLCGGLGLATAGEIAPGDTAAPAPSCTGDVDGDQSVGFHDLHMVLRNWGSCRDYRDFPEDGLRVCAADLSGDGWISLPDLLTVFDHWGACSADTTP